jgi:hypothetical protein
LIVTLKGAAFAPSGAAEALGFGFWASGAGNGCDRIARLMAIDQRKSVPAVIAIIAAIASFFVSAGWGFVLAIIAVIAGILGFLLSASPRRSGGIISIIAIVLGVLAFVVALLKAVF